MKNEIRYERHSPQASLIEGRHKQFSMISEGSGKISTRGGLEYKKQGSMARLLAIIWTRLHEEQVILKLKTLPSLLEDMPAIHYIEEFGF